MKGLAKTPGAVVTKQGGERSTKSRQRRRWRWLIGLLVLIVAGGIFLLVRSSQKPVMITVEKAAVRDLTQTVAATGKIRPELEVKISPEVAGEITELPVVDGQRVHRGDLLIRIRPDSYVANVKQDEAGLSAAEADTLQAKAQMLNNQRDMRRSEELFAKKLVSDSDYRAAQTKVDVAEATYQASLHRIEVARSTLDQAKDLLVKCNIFSPIDGTISVLNSELGERVVATGQFNGTEVMRVARLESLEARVDVNENDVVNVKVNDPVRVQIDSYPGHEFRGSVKRIASTATVQNQGTQQEVTNFEVRIRILQPDQEIRPGMSASVDIETQTVKAVLSVPLQSLTVRSREGGKTAEQMKEERSKNQSGSSEVDAEKKDRRKLLRVVFVKTGDTVKMVPVESGISDDAHVQILKGLRTGDEIVSGSYTAISKDLKDGSKVMIEPPKKNEGK